MVIHISCKNIQLENEIFVIDHINITYNNYHFQVYDTITGTTTNIYEKIEPEILFIKTHTFTMHDENFIIPYYYNDLWMKIIYVLYICGHDEFHISECVYCNKDFLIQNSCFEKSFTKEKLLQVYMAKHFIEIVPNIVIDDEEQCLPSKFVRHDKTFVPLYDYLFTEEHSSMYERNFIWKMLN